MINDVPCQYCGLMHQYVCPKIRSIEYYENGAVKQVEFKTDSPLEHTIPYIHSGIAGIPSTYSNSR